MQRISLEVVFHSNWIQLSNEHKEYVKTRTIVGHTSKLCIGFTIGFIMFYRYTIVKIGNAYVDAATRRRCCNRLHLT